MYDFFKGHTFYMQKTFNEVFADTSVNEECSGKKIKAAISVLVDSYDTIFREILSNVPEKQKELLYAIAIDGEASSITSSAFIRRHRLSSASSVQSAVKKLLEKDLVTVGHKVYSISDRFLHFGLPRRWARTTLSSRWCDFGDVMTFLNEKLLTLRSN